MLSAGWAADTLNAPGKFLVSTPEHTMPRRARAYRLDDGDVAAIAARHASHRPELDELSQSAADLSGDEEEGDSGEASADDAVAALWVALRSASVKDLMAATNMGRSWVYARLQELAAGHCRPSRPWSLGPRR